MQSDETQEKKTGKIMVMGTTAKVQEKGAAHVSPPKAED